MVNVLKFYSKIVENPQNFRLNCFYMFYNKISSNYLHVIFATHHRYICSNPCEYLIYLNSFVQGIEITYIIMTNDDFC